jgi:hypothetical protein
MKKYLLDIICIFAIGFSATSGLAANTCPGKCVNEGGSSIYDSLCKSAGEAHGQQGCENYSQFGCTFYQKLPVKIPGRCLNLGSNSQYDQLCIAAGQAHGEGQCAKYANFGCSWIPERVVCK